MPEEIKYPSNWGPYEVLHVMGEGYARFCAKNKQKVPLEGLQANQMLRVRPTAEGRLEKVTGFEDWSFSIEPGRGIGRHEKRNRDARIDSWDKNIPPEPDWSKLNENYLLQDDLPVEPEADEPMFSMAFTSLELDEHQISMLQPPEPMVTMRWPSPSSIASMSISGSSQICG